MGGEIEYTVGCLFVGGAGGDSQPRLIGALQGPRTVVEQLDRVEDARERAAEGGFDLVVLDLRDPGVDVATIGADWLPASAIVVTGSAAQRELAIDALSVGVANFACEPFDVEQVAAMLRTTARMRRFESELARFVTDRTAGDNANLLVGRSPVMRRLDAAIRRASEIDATVLIEGAAGTGKSFVARLLHRSGRRADAALVSVSAGQLDEHALIEAFEDAAGGTLLIEGVEQLSSACQSRFVRRLKERSSEPASSEPRIVATTAGKLAELTSKNAFREDLYYRLNTFPLQLPLLRERAEDLPELALAFLREAHAISGLPHDGFTPAALLLLENNQWPGNVAELRNVVFRAHVASGGRPIDRVHLLGPSIGVQAPPVLEELGTARPEADGELHESDVIPFQEEEKRILNRALKACKGNVRRAAELLGIGRATLYRKIQVFELTLS